MYVLRFFRCSEGSHNNPSSFACLPDRYCVVNVANAIHSLGAQWGDEGKGKLVDILAAEADICARCAGGNNAGHTIVIRNAKGEKTSYAFNLLPSGGSFVPRDDDALQSSAKKHHYVLFMRNWG